jgi:electron transport complex protein RnfC
MRQVLTFKHGGIRVEQWREWTPASPVRNSFLPNGAVVLLKQHAGSAARCLVRKGEYIREGALIGKAESPNSANIHAPVPGVVRDIRRISLSEGGEAEAVVIALEGSFDRLGKRDERYLWKSMSKRDILNTLREKGVVDTDPPGMPLFDLLSQRTNTRLLVLNAIESEPYLRSESCIIRDKRSEILDGFDILRSVLSPDRSVIAIEDQATATLIGSAVRDGPPPEVAVLEPRYPQDMPRQLLDTLRYQRDADPASALIVRPSTVFALYEAIIHAKPMLERYVTVSGGAIKRPAVFKARIGTPIGDLIEECGGFLGPPARLVIGGPFRGHAVHDLDAPVTKTSSAVLALGTEEIGSFRRSPCIRCGRCAEVCPERLDPDLLFRLVENRDEDRALSLGLDRCTLCGACGYVCPSRMPLVAFFSARRSPAGGRRGVGE